MHFHKMAENIMYLWMEFVHTAKDILASEEWP